MVARSRRAVSMSPYSLEQLRGWEHLACHGMLREPSLDLKAADAPAQKKKLHSVMHHDLARDCMTSGLALHMWDRGVSDAFRSNQPALLPLYEEISGSFDAWLGIRKPTVIVVVVVGSAPNTPYLLPIIVSTAGRLKYADPRSLPSFPSAGLSPGGAAASAAASLGWFSHKPVEPWRPDKTSSASAAAVLAKDYKISPLWEPTMDGTGTKAAVLAVGSASTAYKQSSVKKPSRDSWGSSAATQAFNANTIRPVAPEPMTLTSSSHGSSAATQAFHANRLQSAKVASSPPASPREKSLVAAKGAMSPSKFGSPRSRLRSYSSPQESSYLDATKASVSALNGASIAHRAAMNRTQAAEDTGAIPITTMTRNMFTSHPPVKPEVDEQTNNERIHQSAVEMAKKMYQQQQSRHEESQDGHDAGVGDTTATRYVDLQDAAYRQAQERLAKLQDEHEKNRRYHEYYGAEKPLRRRFTIINKLRRRSASDSDMEDRARSDMIRQQMSLFSSRLDQVDEEKRERDREALLAAARRNVKASLQGMDEKVYHETGKVNPTILGDWQVRAQQAAQLRHDTRAEGDGRVDIGGGMFMDADEIDAIAARRVRPVLDDIHEKAEAERERLASDRMEEEVKKAEAEREKARERELKDLQKRAREEDKQQEKARRQQEKQEEKQRKEEEKTAKAEQKKLAKEEKHKPKAETVSDTHNQESRREENEEQEAETQSRRGSSVSEDPATPIQATAADNVESSQRKSSEGATSPTARVKGWIKNRFSRGKSVSEPGEKKKSFVGGAALRDSGPGGSITSLENRSSSIRDVTFAGRSGEVTAGNHPESLNRDSRGVSPVSAGSGRSSELESFETPRAIIDHTPRQGNSPMRDSRFIEILDH
ncbi:eisosome 1 [Trichoderma arundinaceum]|uniref:Eisosome 1 n=1 Tax=Trichoderma arundinaceum TaxID=490622 RepID=A0A395NV70_TRIAR|nr:eisosome 1 [Trichoderma arundinaceum]